MVPSSHFSSAKFRLWSELKPQALPGFWFSLSKGSKIKSLICVLKKLLILVGDVTIAATGKIQKLQDMACGVVGGDEHKQDQIGIDCKGITQGRTNWGTLTTCVWCLFERKRVWSILIVPSITDAGCISAALCQSGIQWNGCLVVVLIASFEALMPEDLCRLMLCKQLVHSSPHAADHH